MNNQKKLILIGPKTGIQGGGTVSFNHLLDELDRRNIKYTCIDMPGGNYTIRRTLMIFKYIFIFLKTIRKESVISLHGSENTIFTYTLILDLFCRVTDSRLIIRVFGGHHLDYIYKKNSLLKRMIIRHYRKHTLLLQTKGMLERARTEFGIPNVVWFPTSRPKMEPKDRESFNTEGTLELLYLGQIRPKKGIDALIYLAKEIENNDADIRISMYGEVMDDGLLKQIQDQNSGILSYGGKLSPEQVYGVLKNSDVLLIPSKFKREGYPGALIEALNLHVPFIATGHHAYIRELVTEGKEGLFYDMNHPEQLWEWVCEIDHQREKLLEFHDHIAGRRVTFSSEFWNGEYFMNLVNGNMEEVRRFTMEGTEDTK